MKNEKWNLLWSKMFSLCILLTAFCLLLSCSQPILESTECIDSRDTVKKFYSYHIGNEMKPSKEYLEKRKDYLSSELKKDLSEKIASDKDYFTQTADYPKAFRAGVCENVGGKDKTKFEILLFWRTDNKNIQRKIEVEAIKENNKWLINQVTSKE